MYKDISYILFANVILSVSFLSCGVIYGGQDTSESHCIFIKLYRRPRGHEADVNVKPVH